jgi:hypothetical protein
VCRNHIDYLFLSDHVNHMADVSFEKLLLTDDKSRWVRDSKNRAVAVRADCEKSKSTGGIIAPGLEGRLLALGMNRHLSEVWQERQDVYLHETKIAAERLRRETGALIIVPHTEGKSLDTIEAMNPDGLEIYNFHANFDPNIRRNHLDEHPFSHLFSFTEYLLDPYQAMHADFMFMEFVKMYPVYFKLWNQATAHGFKLVGVGGTDAHENVFKQKVTDGERLDSYRRMTRFMSNFVLAQSNDLDSIKTALQSRRSYWVLEGLGTPAQFDFHAENTAGALIEMGNEVVRPRALTFHSPSVDLRSPGISEISQPTIRAELHRIDDQGNETVVAQSSGPGAMMRFEVPAQGAYRVHVFMVPGHLRQWVRRGNLTEREFTWMVSNHIYVK